MKIAICDDNSYDRDFIEKLFKTNPFYKKATVFKFENGLELLNAHNDNHFNIVLLDVDMPDHTGIEIGKYLRQNDNDTLLIFVTNYPQYAIEAFDCHAFHYLLKPIDKAKFDAVIDKAIHKFLIQEAKIPINMPRETRKINITDIYYVECISRHKLTYFTAHGNYTVRDSLANVLDRISHFGFYQTHRGFIVNLNKISKIVHDKIFFDNGMVALISGRKLKEVELVFTNYLEKTL